MQEAKAFLGVKDESNEFLSKQPKTFKKPERKGVKGSRDCFAYLASRGISHQTAQAFKVTDAVIFHHETKTEIPAITFPYLRDGDLKQIKRLGIERHNGKKAIMAESDCEPCLFGWQAINPKERNLVVICEGEIDAISIHQYGFPAAERGPSSSGLSMSTKIWRDSRKSSCAWTWMTPGSQPRKKSLPGWVFIVAAL